MWALLIPRLGISIILPKNHDMDPETRCLCMDYMVAEHDVDRILKMFKDQNKLSNAISYSNRRIVKSKHAYSLRCCLKNTNNIQQFETLNGIGFCEIPSPNFDCGKIHKLQVILYTALFMNVLFKVVIQDFQFIMKYLRIYLFFTG